ncbi:MAG: transposase [Pirellulales bacterium]|nr:transposase [Pirellulales bacterium]
MILAYHAIFTTYGFWLPNDPRGSWSDFVGSWEIYHFGKATKTTTRRSVAAAAHDSQLRVATKKVLKYPPVQFNGRQALAVSKGFTAAIEESGYQILACSILPDHVHVVVRRCHRLIEKIVRHLKSKATAQLNRENLHPLADYTTDRGSPPTPWAEKCWKCYLNTSSDILRAIRYVETNPVKEGKRRQRWSFVVPWQDEG